MLGSSGIGSALGGVLGIILGRKREGESGRASCTDHGGWESYAAAEK
jgi:hypothetical protein